MPNRGWIKLHRQLQENEKIWATPEPFSKRDAWVDILLSVTAIKTKWGKGYQMIDLEPGEWPISYRFLAKRWHWSKGKVARFLAWLGSGVNPEIKTRHYPNQQQSVLSVTGWKVYQGRRDSNGYSSRYSNGTATGTATGQSKEGIKKLKNKTLVDSKPQSTKKKKSDSRVKELFQFWCFKFEEIFGIEYPASFGRDMKILKNQLGYADNSSKIPADCKVVFLAECMAGYLDEQEQREEQYKKPTIPGFQKAFSTIVTKVDWDNPDWKKAKENYGVIQNKIQSGNRKV